MRDDCGCRLELDGPTAPVDGAGRRGAAGAPATLVEAIRRAITEHAASWPAPQV